jgi:hypothetical protein
MAEAPLALIEDLASKEAQVQWIIGGTTEEYLLPEELLSDGLRFCQAALASDNPSTSRQRDTVRALRSAIDEAGDFLDGYNRSNIYRLIEDDANWDAIRRRARDVLQAFAPLPYE